jgi:hypothetical protein
METHLLEFKTRIVQVGKPLEMALIMAALYAVYRICPEKTCSEHLIGLLTSPESCAPTTSQIFNFILSFFKVVGKSTELDVLYSRVADEKLSSCLKEEFNSPWLHYWKKRIGGGDHGSALHMVARRGFGRYVATTPRLVRQVRQDCTELERVG